MRHERTNLIRPLLPALAGGVLSLVQATSAPGQCRYEVTAVFEGPMVWGRPAPISVTGLNEHGHIVGYYNVIFGDEAFLWTPEEGLVTLPRLPGSGTARAYAINDDDVIVGYMEQTDSNCYTACMWKDGEVIDLGYLPDGNWSEASGINGGGQIVGVSLNNVAGPMHAVLWEDGEILDLSVFFDTEDSVAQGINDHGQISGWMGTSWLYDSNAFVLDREQVLDLGTLPGGLGAVGYDINERGWVAGYGTVDLPLADTVGVHAFLYRGVRICQLDELPGHVRGFGRSINLLGQVVGSSDEGQTGYRAMLWQNGRACALDDLLVEGSDLQLYIAGGVNDSGQIAANTLTSSLNHNGALITPRETVAGDVDGDCNVNIDDLFAVLGFWGLCDGCPEDINQDGKVDLQDLLAVIENWG
jgi:probable HAF family extracellular repeat protein